jgi:murein DD-endopeptidase MepM/ murein hydrolase activator NlpD
MQHHFHPKKRSRKIFLTFPILIIITIVGLKLYKSDEISLNKPTSVATSTPAKTPKPKPTPKPNGEMEIVIYPSSVMQGEPAIITVNGLSSTTLVKSFTFDNRPLINFLYEGQITAFFGADLNYATGTFPVVLTLTDGRQIRKDFVINKRPDIRRPFDIPEKLGGNTPESIKTLFTTLAQEGKIINAIPTGYKILWTEEFRSPFEGSMAIDDPYGYTRVTGIVTMPHKGVDLVADIGTPIYAMNRGIVRLTENMRNYGNTVVIDHGFGVQTVYMHLSEIKTVVGKTVEKGELIALSGDTGYTLNPHLHLTVRIWDVSIDPIKFLELFGS